MESAYITQKTKKTKATDTKLQALELNLNNSKLSQQLFNPRRLQENEAQNNHHTSTNSIKIKKLKKIKITYQMRRPAATPHYYSPPLLPHPPITPP